MYECPAARLEISDPILNVPVSFLVVGHESPTVAPDELRQLMLSLYPRENCTQLYNEWSNILNFTDQMVCAGRGVDGKGTCQVRCSFAT